MDQSQRGPKEGVVPHLSIDGASKASEFYQKAFGATELFRMPAEDGERLLHCHLKINGGSLMLCDCFPEFGFSPQPSNNYTMHLQVDDADRWWNRALEAGAEVQMPLEDQFWGDRYGKLRDPFGISWSIGMPVNAS